MEFRGGLIAQWSSIRLEVNAWLTSIHTFLTLVNM